MKTMALLMMSASAIASSTAAGAADSAAVSPIVVVGSRSDDTPEKLDHIQPEVDGTKITVTKKTSVAKLDLIPTIVDNNQRALFARTPGLFVSEQHVPTQFNMGYRGLGNPQESEYILLLQDGIPISTDWIGFPTAYYMPLPQSVGEVQLIRGGSSLLYGPNPAPAVNLVSKRPAANQPFGAYSENVIGSHNLFSSFNTVQGSTGDASARINLGHVESDGQRDNGASRVQQGDIWLGYRPTDTRLWYIKASYYDASSGDPGKLGYPQYRADPDQSPTPFNHNWVRRTAVTLGNESDLGNGWKTETKLWMAWQNLSQRSAAAKAVPASMTLVDENFRS